MPSAARRWGARRWGAFPWGAFPWGARRWGALLSAFGSALKSAGVSFCFAEGTARMFPWRRAAGAAVRVPSPQPGWLRREGSGRELVVLTWAP